MACQRPVNGLDGVSRVCDSSSMEPQEREILTYVTGTGKCPFRRWVSTLRYKRARARIFARIDRVRLGNFGDCRSLGGGVYELRIDYGPGYRAYFALRSDGAVLLLSGGPKSTQTRDIRKARTYWQEYQKHAD